MSEQNWLSAWYAFGTPYVDKGHDQLHNRVLILEKECADLKSKMELLIDLMKKEK